MKWSSYPCESGKVWWMAASDVPCFVRVRQNESGHLVELFDGTSGTEAPETLGPFRAVREARGVASRKFRVAVDDARDWSVL